MTTNTNDEESYPHLDADGNYASYQEGGRWINWWARKMPKSFLFKLWKEFVTNRDESGIKGSTREELDAAMPVLTPYFAQEDHEKDENVVRATWIGHATVLAEVGGTVLITDPIFSDRASMFSFSGPKRYRLAGLKCITINLY